MSVKPARKVSATELLDMRERAWSKKLRGVSLVAEIDAKDAHSKQVASVLGRAYRKWVASGREPRMFFRRWPACIAVAVTGIAARDYRRGELWSALWAAIGYQGEQDDRAIWGRGFAAALDAMGMPTFQGMPMPYLGPILMHTGIPTYCLDDYFRLLGQRMSVDRGLDAESFLAWATAPGSENRLLNVDVPVRRFLQHGTEYALDFVERSFELLDRLRDQTAELDGVGLPPRVLERARYLASEGRLDLTTSRSPSTGRTRIERPRIALDPFGGGIEVVLPPVGDTPDGTARWNVTADGVTTTVRSQAMWVGVAEAPSTTHSLLRPVRTVVVAMDGWPYQTELQVVDPAAPMLVFGEDGRRLPATAPLPPDTVWVAHPADYELLADGPLQVVIEGQLPLGWEGWRLRKVSLKGVRSLGLDKAPAARRSVRGHTHARISTGDPVAGVTTPYGSPVFSQVPEIWLPGNIGAEATWHVEVRRSGTDIALVTESYRCSEPLTVSDLWDSLPRPLVGAFDTVVRGPLGRGVNRSLFIAEGLCAAFTPRVRLFGTAGLADGRAELSAPVGARVEPRVTRFSSAELASIVEYRTEIESEPLVVTPPHVQVMHDRLGEAPVWRAGPLRIPTDAFAEEPGTLLVRIPGVKQMPPLQVMAGGQVVQDAPASGGVQAGTARYDMVKIKGTVEDKQQAELLVEVDGRLVRVASVRPRRLAAAAKVEGDHILLLECVLVDGLTAAVYATHAPWREPVIVPVEEGGTVPLPWDLCSCGPLLVSLQVDDPWVPVEWSRWPDAHVVASADGFLVSEDPEEVALSRYLAGEGGFPDDVRDLSRIWTLVDLADRLRVSSEVRRFVQECSRPILRRPADALTALVKLGLEPDRSLHALITSGLAAVAVPQLDPPAVAKMWATTPAAAVLAGDLGDEDCLATAERQCGEVLLEIRSTGTDPSPQAGRFGLEADRLTHLAPQAFDAVLRAAHIVPKALLDADTRAAGALQLFKARHEPAAKESSHVVAHVVKTAERLLERPQLLRQVVQRKHPQDRGGWYSLPAASAAFALIARLAARGDEACRAAEQTFRNDWAHLASVAPDLVTIDLVLAELLASTVKTEAQ
ncbi:hypothetical protein SAMN05421833_12814 [Microbispora rosea]|uniref:Uncharacterized protein n=1 Tax=Microbispora rosea TaxID=58117 RepID=A0A1N7GDM7_9ACTN|nr:hypothetical protein Mro03_57940 [Microbispora rosea subsp. rosea]SIS10725.1 hypothetical protein SAMN05421833_12814 [Microbispora rosea]